MSRHLLYIINPIAGTRGKTSLRQKVEQRTRAAQLPFSVVDSSPDGDYRFLEKKIVQESITDVIIAGGDGTVSQVVNALRHFHVRFGILPCGSGNGLAYAAGIPDATDEALDIIFRGRDYPTDAFFVNGVFCCHLAGLGFDAQVAHDFARQRRRGLLSYVWQVTKHFFTAKPYLFEIIAADKKWTVNAFFISLANSNQFGNHFTIAPSASLRDGLLDVVVVASQPRLRLLRNILRQVKGRNAPMLAHELDHQQGVLYFQTASLHIVNKGEAPLHRDGDPASTAAELQVEVMSEAFRLIQP